MQGFEPWYRKQLITDGKSKRHRNGHLILAEVLTLLIAYHQSGMSCFKYFYLSFFNFHQKLFPGLVHYTRFVKLSKFGMKLHVIFNTLGEIVRLTITPGNINDKKPVPQMVKDLTAKLIGDKGYLSKKLFQELFARGVTLITKIKKNMKSCLMEMADKLMLMRRSFVETIFSSILILSLMRDSG